MTQALKGKQYSVNKGLTLGCDGKGVMFVILMTISNLIKNV